MPTYQEYRLQKGSVKSGNFGHAGRLGEIGGSLASNEDYDPEDAQARKDVMEIAGIYGIQVGGKGGKIWLGKKSIFGGVDQKFESYVDAEKWLRANMSKLR